jgi:hypothetical protein
MDTMNKQIRTIAALSIAAFLGISLLAGGVFTYCFSEINLENDSFRQLSHAKNKISKTFAAAPPPTSSVSVRVNASSDDAEQTLSTGAVVLNSTDLELADDGAATQLVGMRFNSVQIPKGASIMGAYIEFETDVAWSSACSLTIRGQAADSPSTFTTTSNDLSTRTKTTASVAWAPAAWNTVDQKHQTPDLTTVVQEIINRPGWAEGNSLVLFAEGSGTREAESFDGESTAAPLLIVNFTVPEICGNGLDDDGDGLTDSADPQCGYNCCTNLLQNGGFESYNSTFTFSQTFQGLPAQKVNSSSANNYLANNWVAAAGGSQSFWLIRDWTNATNNPEGNYFAYIKGQNNCVQLCGFNSVSCNISNLLCQPWQNGDVYEFCFKAAAWNETITAGTPSGTGTQVSTDVGIDVDYTSSAQVGWGPFNLPASANFNSLKWQTVCYQFTYNAANPVKSLYISNRGTTGILIDDASLRNVSDCNEVCNNSADDDGDGYMDCADDDCNKIQNGEFDNWTINWMLYNQSGNSSTHSVVNTSQLSGINAGFVDIATASGTDWHIQYVQPGKSIQAGNRYNLTFMAKATASRPATVMIQRTNTPYTNYWSQTLNLTTAPQIYSFDFQMDSTNVDQAGLYFNLGASSADVYIDKVSWTKICAEFCTNSSDDDGDGLSDCNDSDCKPVINGSIRDCQPTHADIDLNPGGKNTPFSYRWSDMTTEALWQFNNSTADGSGNNHNQTSLTGTASYDAKDKTEGSHSFVFNGATFIRYGVDGGFLETAYSARTYSFWVKPTNLTGTKILFDQGGSSAGMACKLSGNLLSAAYRVSGTQYTTGSHTFPADGAWHHVAVVFSSGTLTCYLDGVASTSATSGSTSIAANSNNDGIGARNGTDAFGSSAANYYNGKMDDLRLYYSALPVQKIADLARNDGDRLNMAFGNYTVTVSNASGCTATKSFTVSAVCPEICTNGIDDDGDGAIDALDSECNTCAFIGQNLVVNGEFDNGNTGFTSNYTYTPIGDMCDTWGIYSIGKNIAQVGAPVGCNNAIWAVSDRNGPAGNFMLIDPSNATGVNDVIWGQTVSVCPNTDYVFSVWTKNMYYAEANGYAGVDPNFQFSINGQTIPGANFTMPRQVKADSAKWIKVQGIWNSGSASSASLRVVNMIPGAYGNDLALDGIFFGLCGKTVAITSSASTLCNGASLTLSASGQTTSSGWGFYEWLRNGVVVSSGATATSFTANTAGAYALRCYTTANSTGCPQMSNTIVLTSAGCPEVCGNGTDDDGDGLTDCNDSDCVKITLSDLNVSACIDHPLQDVATVSLNVAWTTPPANDSVVVSIYGKKRYIATGLAAGNQTVAFNVPADGSINNTITAYWINSPSLCNKTTTYNAPAACSSNTIACNILYLCGQDKPYDGDAWDHGFINYLDAVNGSNTVTPILTKADASGYGTYDPVSPSTFVNVNFNNYQLIVISATTENHIAAGLVNYLKNSAASILNCNYTIINDLGMAATEGSYQFQSYAYTDNTTSKTIYDYHTISPYYSQVLTKANVVSGGTGYLWANANNMTPNTNSLYFVYDRNDILPGVNAGHGARVYLGYHMNGIYVGAETGYVLPAPAETYLDPVKHFTLDGKYFFDQAIVAASADCAAPENCSNGMDDDGDGWTDCADTDCSAMSVMVSSPTHRTVADGDWYNASTWLGGNVPGTNVESGNVILIEHEVTSSNEVKLQNGGQLFIREGGLFLQGQNLIIENGRLEMERSILQLENSGNIQLTSGNAYFKAKNSQVMVTGQNFQNSNGVRVLENVCLTVNEVFENSDGTDSLVNVCAEVGVNTSGNFKNNSGTMVILHSEFNLPNGNFQNQSGATLRGSHNKVWVQNGNFQNDGDWAADIDDYCVSGQVNVPVEYLPASENCTTIATVFSPCDCGCMQPKEVCSNGLDDDGDGWIDCVDVADCGAISITGITASACDPATNSFTLSLQTQWSAAPAGSSIVLSAGGFTKTFSPADYTSPHVFEFYLPANGSANNPVTAAFSTSPDCAFYGTYHAPNACFSGCLRNILYLCGTNKQYDAEAYDHGLISYLQNLGHTVTPALPSPTGLRNPVNNALLANSVSQHDIIIVSHSAYFDIEYNHHGISDSLYLTPKPVLMLTEAGINSLGLANYADYNYPLGSVWIENGSSSILPSGLPNNAALPVMNDPELEGLNGYPKVISWGQGLGAGAIIGAYAYDQPNVDNGSPYFYYPQNATLANGQPARGKRIFLGLLIEGASAYVPEINLLDPTDFFTASGCAILNKSLQILADCPEICGNSLDDDFDGLTDCADSDCGPTVFAGTDISICSGTSADLNALVSDGAAPYSYAWNQGLGAGQSHTVSPSSTTTYSVTVTSASGCTATDQVTVTVIPCPEICADGLDNDNDGLLDCADPDCAAAGTPVLADDVYTSCPGVPFTEQVIFNDFNIQYPGFSIPVLPTKGSVSINNQGKFIYSPFGSACGVDSFYYQVCNLVTGCCDQAKVTIQIGDALPPQLLNVPADLTISCEDIVPAPPLVLGVDACPGIYVSMDETDTQTNAGTCQNYTITRTWTATDLCGNSGVAQQIITVQDLTSPEMFRVYTLANDSRMVGGWGQKTTHAWKYVKFPITFSQQPVVIPQLITEGETMTAAPRVRNVTTQGFEMKLMEEENADNVHQAETVAWIAIEPGSDTGGSRIDAGIVNNVTNTPKTLTFSPAFPAAPSFLAALQSANEADPVVVRYQNLTAASVEFFLEEETSKDPEITHGNEKVGYVAFTPLQLLTDEGDYFIGETGSVNINENWKTVLLSKQYNKPVVVFGGLLAGDNPATIRVRNVTATSFEVRIQEWAYLNGTHPLTSAPYMVMEGSIPAAPENYCAGNAAWLQPGVNVLAIDNCDVLADVSYEESVDPLSAGLVMNRKWSVTDNCGNSTIIDRNDTCTVAAVRLKLLLSGALINNGGSALMRDDLRQNAYLPLLEPYGNLVGFKHQGSGGSEVMSPNLLEVPGDNAILDWVFIEIRDPGDPKTVLATCSGLLQRDGDVVSYTSEPVILIPDLIEGDYYVGIRHRNHIGVMTDYVSYLSSNAPPFIDFTDLAEQLNGSSHATKTINGKRTLWGGDLNGDRKTIYQGPNNDSFSLFSLVLSDGNNVNFLANYITKGYNRQDLNLDGKAIYQGPNNDRATLLSQMILFHPGNHSLLANYIVPEFMP